MKRIALFAAAGLVFAACAAKEEAPKADSAAMAPAAAAPAPAMDSAAMAAPAAAPMDTMKKDTTKKK